MWRHWALLPSFTLSSWTKPWRIFLARCLVTAKVNPQWLYLVCPLVMCVRCPCVARIFILKTLSRVPMNLCFLICTHHKYPLLLLPSSGSFLADASRSATLAANDTCLLDSVCWKLLALRPFLSAFRFLFCISFSYTAHLLSCCVRRFWAARSLSKLGTLSSCCSSWISSRWLAMMPGSGWWWRGEIRGGLVVFF